MKDKLSMVTIIILVIAMILLGCGRGNQAGPANNVETDGAKSTPAKEAHIIALSLGHEHSADSERQVVAAKLAELAKEKSHGTILITLFPQGGQEVKQIQSVRSGTQGMMIVSSAALESTIKEFSLFDLPYLFDDAKQADKILKGEVGKKFLGMLAQYNMIGLGFAWPNERNLFSNIPVYRAEDLTGFKTRVIQAPGYVKSYEAFGAYPLPMAYGEVFLAMQQGLVDGADVPPDQFVENNFIEISEYYNETKMHYVPIVIAVSKLTWDSMTSEQQEALQQATDEALAFEAEYNKTYYDKYYEKMKKKGIKIIEPDTESFKAASKSAYNDILKDIPTGQELLKAVEAAKNE
ncbi:TRAP transporter substrate-binding protein [Sporomusa aerivorans]|uniref:TRAP transporter substrate-binding protein n=1 Tax=Sporomusa aerivorans TaxID=204936 RepID=UPI00352B44BF